MKKSIQKKVTDIADTELTTEKNTCSPENDVEIPPLGKRHKIKMNRLFRERVGGTFLPFPEADNYYERVRSKLVIKLKTNFLSNCRKKR